MGVGEDNELRDRSTGELLKRLSQQTSELVRKEVDLAKAELGEKAQTAGKGAGLFGGATLFGVTAFLALTGCLVALLGTAIEVWLAALIVAVVYAVIAGVLALMGKKKVQEAGPPVPEQTVETLKEDVEWAKTQRPSGTT
jgi:uncharacterized membrane protein YqjE